MRRGCFFLAVVLLAGCGPKPAREPSASDTPLSDGYTLLAELLEKEKQVDLVLVVKNAPGSVAETIKEIAAFSGERFKVLKDLAEGSEIALDRNPLPPIEVRARAAIEKTQTGELLGNRGREFTVLLLDGQVQGLDYMKHLCEVLLEIEKNGERRAYLEKTGKEAWKLRNRAFKLLCHPE
jgi:hypothetical protein